METNDPEGWTIIEYKSFKVSVDDSETSSSDDEEQIFAKSSVVRKSRYKKIVCKEELLPE